MWKSENLRVEHIPASEMHREIVSRDRGVSVISVMSLRVHIQSVTELKSLEKEQADFTMET